MPIITLMWTILSQKILDKISWRFSNDTNLYQNEFKSKIGTCKSEFVRILNYWGIINLTIMLYPESINYFSELNEI